MSTPLTQPQPQPLPYVFPRTGSRTVIVRCVRQVHDGGSPDFPVPCSLELHLPHYSSKKFMYQVQRFPELLLLVVVGTSSLRTQIHRRSSTR